MKIARAHHGPARLLRLAVADPPEIGSNDVLMRVIRTTVGPPAAPMLGGAAYLAALRGDPWRPQV